MAQTPRAAIIALCVLTFATGIVDAASVLDLGHVFTANMTGNIVFLGFALARQGTNTIVASLVALAGFLLGALVGGRLARAISPRSLTLGLGVEVIALAAAAGLAAAAATLFAVALLALAMGLRNAMIRKLAIADMTTTVLTLTLTGLAADSSLAGGSNPRWQRRIAAVVAMLAGALVGAWLVERGPALTIAVAAALEAPGAAVLVVLSRRGQLISSPPSA